METRRHETPESTVGPPTAGWESQVIEMVVVVVTGTAVVMVLGMVVGLTERRQLGRAWSRVGVARRRVAELRRAVEELEEELMRRRLYLDQRERLLDLRDQLGVDGD